MWGRVCEGVRAGWEGVKAGVRADIQLGWRQLATIIAAAISIMPACSEHGCCTGLGLCYVGRVCVGWGWVL